MIRNHIFIFEFVSGGGFNQSTIPSSLLCEGFGMLRSIIEDFKSMNFFVSTILDSKISFLSHLLKIDTVALVGAKDNYLDIFEKYVEKSDYIFIIAPEFSNILYNLTKIAKKHNKIILSVNLEGIKLGTSKLTTYKFFRNCKISTPKTYLIPFKKRQIDLKFILDKLTELKHPIIIKPIDGVGAESIYYFDNNNEINEFMVNENQNFNFKRTYILQEFIEGNDLSVSLINSSLNLDLEANSPIILSINSQYLTLGTFNCKSEYFGGSTPAESYEEIHKDLEVILNRSNLSQIKGYYGIDFIRREDKSIYFIEINPRLTTSYIGLRNTINFNPVELILNSKPKLSVVDEIKYNYHSIFTRLDLQYKGNLKVEEIQEKCLSNLIQKIPEFVTPPISLDVSRDFSGFIATKTKDFKSSKKRISEIHNLLKDLDFIPIKSMLIR
jgi:predicted ATP-grasp superfamily ATP-dependent carboligase